ncbi:MAG: helicase-exonuclease AddAB subunit AddA [Lachnospiraceae bacterium]
MEYTIDQQKVIRLHHRNLLVSAAAGSGKTAVLVERIVQMLLQKEHPVDIDRLLVVTFTKAAAAEMRERISIAIEKQLTEQPENEHLEKQAALLHHAQITTIDSFCQSVLRNNFDRIGLDPGFRVADQNEIRLMKEDILEELLEEHFEAGEEAFLNLIDGYQGKGRDGRIEDILLDIYEYALSFPWPKEWLEGCVAHYRIADAATLEQEPWMQDLLETVRQKLSELTIQLQEAHSLCLKPEGPLAYEKTIQEDENQLVLLCEKKTYDGLRKGLCELQKGKLSAIRSGSCDEVLKVRVADIRKKVYAELEKIKKQYFALSLERLCEILQLCAPTVETLVSLVLQFDERFRARKRELNTVDFSDMEHMALEILLERDGERIVPTQAALDYRACFEEILIDEYQDSNMVQELLLQSISGEDEGRPNRFMVGDVKQSIYRFRLARPEIFLEKYEAYSGEDSSFQKIDLHQNFRSRKEVLSCVNEIFYRIMRPQIGHIRYDEQAALYPGAGYPEDTHTDNTAELLLLEENAEENTEALDRKGRIAAEARLCAGRIRELVGHAQVTERRKNPQTGEEETVLRPAQYRDIVILLRTAGDWFDIYRQVFEEEGIPAYVATKTGYFSAAEIRTVFNYLKILDNPLQDIPMYGAMISPIGGFTEEEVVRLKSGKHTYLYEELQEAANNSVDGELQQKAQAFLAQYAHFRACMLYTPIHELLRMIIRETGYDKLVEAMPGGSRRKANLEALIDKAVAYEQTSFHGLFHFMRYIDHLKKYEVDYGEADLADEGSDLVRIMTIHASKGLEFPICFVCGTGKLFNMQDERKPIVTNLLLGIGLDYVNPVERTRTRNLFKNVMNLKEHEENLGEELRVLYVALTRAKEKLIITGTVKDYEKRKQEYSDRRMLSVESQESADAEDQIPAPLPVQLIRDAKCMLDWILAAVYVGGIDEKILQVCYRNAADLEGMQIKAQVQEQLRYKRLLDSEKTNAALEEELRSRFAFSYPYRQLEKLYTKTTVSELKLAALEESKEVTETAALLFPETQTKEYVPAFREAQEKGGTNRGNAYHKAMELLDFTMAPEENEIRRYLEGQVESGTLTSDYLELLRMDRLSRFLQSPLAKRMAQAQETGRLYREQPFVFGLPANRLKSEFPETETILIQGIIDVFWEEADGLVVLDYKTDRVDTPQELIERYHTQLDYYAEALERLMHRRVKEKLIYSFALGRQIILP